MAELILRFEDATRAYRAFLAARGKSREVAKARLDAALRAVDAAKAALDVMDRR